MPHTASKSYSLFPKFNAGFEAVEEGVVRAAII
jgi:hypothetical protein